MKNGPSRKLARCQIIGVDCAQLQIDSARNAWRDETADGASLAAAYYLVIWPAAAIHSSNRRAPRYFGPLGTAAARMLRITAMSLGIVEAKAGTEIDAASRCRSEGRDFVPTVDDGAKPLAPSPFAPMADEPWAPQATP